MNKKDEQMQLISMRMPRALLDRIARIAWVEKTHQAKFMRAAIEEKLAKAERELSS